MSHVKYLLHLGPHLGPVLEDLDGFKWVNLRKIQDRFGIKEWQQVLNELQKLQELLTQHRKIFSNPMHSDSKKGFLPQNIPAQQQVFGQFFQATACSNLGGCLVSLATKTEQVTNFWSNDG